jgi:nucleoside-diphosphate-sugar epimerase
MKALVTGATGYVGSKLCERLLTEGWQVHAIVRTAGRPLPDTLRDVAAHHYDGCTQSLLDAVSAAQPSVVFHLASLFIAEHRTEQVTNLINSNVLFGTQLAEACARAGVRRFINTGTSWQHYRSDAYDPVCLYAATKQAFEDILDFYADAFDMRVVTLKLFDTYGPDDPRPKLINLLVKALHSGEPLGLSPGEQRLDLVHIDDVTRAFSLSAQRLLLDQAQQPHERYAVSSGQALSVRELVAVLEQVSGRTLNVTLDERTNRKREVMETWIAGHSLPGFSPTKDLRSSIFSLVQSR